MEFAQPDNTDAVFATARNALKALGLRAGAVDLFTDVDGDASALRVIEVNANPSIRFLEDSGRADLILRIWRHTFSSLGLIDV
jgi:glutathione synthase/RimK-type ligase-like ATP-grasp enzyme